MVDELMRSGNYTFPADMDIPVIAPDGSMGTVPSANAQQAWKDGFRWPTQADKEVDEQKARQAVTEENFDNSPLAFGAGVLRGGSLGVTDPLMIGMGALVGKGEEVREGLQSTKEVNPAMSTAGEVTGVVTSSLLSGGTSGAAQTLGAAGRGAAAVTKGVVAATGAAKAGKITQGIVRGAAEGAYWGLGAGVSEAALSGKPDEIVDHIVSNVGLGALTGGAFGGAIGGVSKAAPFMKRQLDASLEALNGKSSGVTNTIAKGLVKPMMWLKGEGALAKKYGDLIDDPRMKKLMVDGSIEEMDALAASLNGMKSSIKAESKDLAREIQASIKNAGGAEKRAILDELSAANGDIRAALGNAKERIAAKGKAYDQYVDTLTGPPRMGGDTLIKKIEAEAINLSKYSGDAREMAKRIKQETMAHAAGLTEGTETNLLYTIKELTKDRSGLSGEGRKQATKLFGMAKNKLESHENHTIANHWSELNPLFAAERELTKIINKSAKRGGGTTNLLLNPNTQADAAKFMSSLRDFVPELTTFREAGNSIAKQKTAFLAFEDKYRQLMGKRINPDTIDDFKSIISDIVKDPKVLTNVARLEKLQAATQGLETLNPYDAAIRLNKALGRETTSIQHLEKLGQNWETIQALRAQKSGNGLLDTATAYATGGASLPYSAAKAAAGNPIGVTKVMSRIQDAVDSGSKKLAKALDKTSKAIVSNYKPAALTAQQLSIPRESTESRQNRFNTIKTSVTTMSTPEGMSEAITKAAGGVPNAPNLKIAIGLRLQTATQYLLKALPHDPLADTSIFPTKTGWKPSDLETTRYLRRVDAVNNPIGVIDRVESGTATFDELDALKNVHPDIYNQLQSSIYNAIIDHGDEIPYARRVQLGTLFQIPTDYSMTPQFITAMQAPYQPMDQGGRPEGSRTKNIDISPLDTVQTETSKITYSDN